jgi:hypothetical protein
VDPKTGALLAARAYINGRLSDWRSYQTTIVDQSSGAHTS